MNYMRRLINAAVNMRLGRKMYDSITAAHRKFCSLHIANIAFDERAIGIAGNIFQVCQIPRVRQLIVVHDFIFFILAENVANEVRTYKSRATRYENFHRPNPPTALASLRTRLAPESATSVLASRRDLNVPASVHQPSNISQVKVPSST